MYNLTPLGICQCSGGGTGWPRGKALLLLSRLPKNEHSPQLVLRVRELVRLVFPSRTYRCMDLTMINWNVAQL